MGKFPGPENGYIDILDDAVLKAIEQDKRSFNPLRPSSAGKCRRELGYEYMQYKGFAEYQGEKIAPTQKRIFELGHSIEYHLLRQFSHVVEFASTYKQQRVLVTKLNDGNFITGSTDVAFWSEEYKCIADVKSKKDKWSAFYSSDWKETTERFKAMNSVQEINERVFWISDLVVFLDELYTVDAKGAPWLERNFLQLNLYANNDFFVQQGADHAAIIQYNKNDSQLREFRFKPHKGAAQQAINDFHMVHDTIMAKESADDLPRDFNLGTGPCAFCNFKDICRPKTDALKDHFDEHYPKKSWPRDTGRLQSTGKQLDELYDVFKKGKQATQHIDKVEQSILKIMEDNKLWKVRFPDGHIYQRREYKTPRPHWKMKRIKL